MSKTVYRNLLSGAFGFPVWVTKSPRRRWYLLAVAVFVYASVGHASDQICENLFSNKRQAAIGKSEPLQTLADSHKIDAFANEIKALARSNPYMLGFKVSELLDRLFQPSIDKSSAALDFLTANGVHNSTAAEVDEINQVNTRVTATHSKLSTVLNDPRWQQLDQDNVEIGKTTLSLIEEMKACQNQAQVCRARVRSKADAIEAHINAVLELERQLLSDREVAVRALDEFAKAETNQQNIDDVTSAMNGALQNVHFTLTILEQHLGAVRLEMNNAFQGLQSVGTLEILVEAAIQRGLPVEAKVRESEERIKELSKTELLTFRDQSDIEEFLRLITKNSFFSRRSANKMLGKISTISHWSATNALILWLNSESSSLKAPAEISTILASRRFHPKNREALDKFNFYEAAKFKLLCESFLLPSMDIGSTAYLLKVRYVNFRNYGTLKYSFPLEKRLNNDTIPVITDFYRQYGSEFFLDYLHLIGTPEALEIEKKLRRDLRGKDRLF